MKRPVIRIGSISYRLTRTPEGENCCEMCDIKDYCMNRIDKYEDPECLTFDSKEDWHLKRIDEDKFND